MTMANDEMSATAGPVRVSAGSTPVDRGAPSNDAGPRPPRRSGWEKGWRRARSAIVAAPPWFGVAVALVVMIAFFASQTDLFLTTGNIQNNIARGSAVTLLLAAGTTLVMATGVIDLSIGALLSLSTMALVGFMNLSLTPVVSVLATVAFAAVATTATNGLLITKAKLNFFVVTLGTMSAFTSLAQLPTEGLSISLSGKRGESLVESLGNSTVAGVPISILIAGAVVLLLGLMMRFTTLGRAIDTVGGNEEAARLAGIHVTRVRLIVFALNGALIGLAAVLLSGRTFSSSPTVGIGMELPVLAAVLLGGSSFVGGRSTLIGTVFGVAFTAVLENGMNLLQVATFWKGLVTGVVLIAAVSLDRMRRSSS